MAPAEKNPDLVSFGANVRARRTDLKLTQPQLAKAVGVTRQAIYNWETGSTGVSDEVMLRLSEALDTTPEKLSPSWEPNSTGWGGRRGGDLPSPQRLDRVEAELRAIRATLEANGFTVETVDPALELEEHAEKHEQQLRDSAGTSSDHPAKAQES